MPHLPRNPVQAVCPIEILIVGGSIAGLASAFALRRAGHRVTLLEKYPKDKQLSKGSCRLTPNATRVLQQWGLREDLDNCDCGRLDTALFYTIAVGEQENEFLGGHYYSQELLKETGGGEWRGLSYDIFRETLRAAAVRVGANVLLGIEVVSIDPSAHSVIDAAGKVYTADLIIAADGALGIGRKVLGGEDGVPSIYNFYTTVLPAEDVSKVPELIGGEEATGRDVAYIRWGDGYCLYYNEVNTRGDMGIFAYSDITDHNESWSEPAVKLSDVLNGDNVPEWVRRVCSLAPPAFRCQNRLYKPLEDWTDEGTHSFVLVGEAAHPSPEGSLQSFSMALEDAAVIGKLFSHLKSKDEIPHLIIGFQDVRQERCRRALDRESQRLLAFTLKKGPEQEARDRFSRTTSEEPGGALGIYKLQELEEMYTYDCEDKAEDWWRQWNVLHIRAHNIEQIDSGPVQVAMEVEVNQTDELHDTDAIG